MKKIESRKIKAGVAILAVLMIEMSSVSAFVANSDENIIANSDDSVGSLPREDSYIDYVNVTLNSTDDWSGVAYTLYKIIDVTPEWLPYQGTFTIEGVGNYTILVYAVDMAGNIEEIKTILANVSTDTVAPVTTWTLEGGSYQSP